MGSIYLLTFRKSLSTYRNVCSDLIELREQDRIIDINFEEEKLRIKLPETKISCMHARQIFIQLFL